MRTFTTLIPAGLAAALVLTACSGSDAEFSVQNALERLPDPDPSAPVTIAVGDVDAAAELIGLDRDGDVADDRPITYQLSVNFEGDNARAFLPLPGMVADDPDSAAELGWGYNDIGQFAEVVSRGSGPVTFVTAFQPREGAELGTEEMTEVGDGVFTIGEGEDLETNFEETSRLRPTGWPLRAGEAEGQTYLSGSTPLVRRALDGETDLGEDEGLVAIAERLDEHEVYGAYLLVRSTFGLDPARILGPGTDPSDAAALLEALAEDAVQQPFTGAGVGWAVEDDTPVAVVVYDFGSTEAAEQAVAGVESVWAQGTLSTGQRVSDLVTVREVAAQDATVSVVLDYEEPTSAYRLMQWLEAGDTPFMHN